MSEQRRLNPLQNLPQPVRLEVERQKLLHQLGQARDAKLVLLLAPSGFGKTTLLAQHARNLKSKYGWVYLTQTCANGDVFVETLCGYFGFDVSQINSPEHLAEKLNSLEENFSFIIDGIEQLGSNASEWLMRFVQSLGEGHQVLVAGHSSENLPAVKMISSGQAVVLDQNELRFSETETNELLKKSTVHFSAQELFKETDGWPIVVSLAALTDSYVGNIHQLIIELLKRLPEELNQVLPDLALLETWDESTAKELEVKLPVGWVQELVRAGLPINVLTQKSCRAHHLLRRVLEDELEKEEQRCLKIRDLMVERFVVLGDECAAIEQCLKAGWIERAQMIAWVLVMKSMLSWDSRLIMRALVYFPKDALTTDLAASLAGAYIVSGKLVAGDQMLTECKAKEPENFFVLYWLATLAEYRGDFDSQLIYANRVLTQDVDEQIKLFFSRHRLQALSGTGHPEVVFEEASKLIESENETPLDIYVKSTALFFMQFSRFKQGEFRECEKYGRQKIELDKLNGLSVASLPTQNLLAYMYVFQGKRQDSFDLFEPSIQYAEIQEHPMLIPLLGTKGRWFMLAQHFEVAREQFLRAHKLINGFGAYQNLYELKLIDVDWLMGIVPQSIPDFVTSNEPISVLYFFLKGKLAWSQQRWQEATEWFNKISPYELFELARAQAYLADIALKQNKLQRHHIEAMLKWPEKLGSTDILLPDVHVLSDLYKYLNEQSEWKEKFAFAVQTKSEILQDTVQIQIQTFGHVQVLVNNQEVLFPMQRAAHLLVYLALNGPSSREKIIQGLWPEDDEDHSEYARVVIRKLRDALLTVVAFNPVEYKNGVYTLNPRFKPQLDLQQLEVAEDLIEMESALELYKGEFLPKADSDWVNYQRTKALDKVVNIGLKLAGYYQTSDLNKAQYFCRWILHTDPVCEPAQQLLAELHTRIDSGKSLN